MPEGEVGEGVTVFPRPRHVELDGAPGSTVEIAAERDRHLPVQGYELAIGPGGTRIRHADEAGLRYARHTLGQLAAAPTVASGLIRDWPDFAHRGFLLDVSRDRVPTMATLEWLVSRLADLRYNHLQLYTEHTFAYPAHEVVWRDASPVTPGELRRLDQLCHDHGIELCANQSTFGHMDRWLRHAAYRPRAECPDGSEPPGLGRRIPAWSLEPTPGNAAFALDLVRQQADNVRSRRVNVNADEPFDLGLGRSRAAVRDRGRAVVYLEHLRRLLDPLIAEGHETLFWGDVLVRNPDLLPRLPDGGVTALVWTYEQPRPDEPPPVDVLGPELAELLGLPARANLGFAAFVEPYVDAARPFWVAPGTSSWHSLVGRWANARANLLDAATVGREAGASGYLVTDWGDSGHPQPLPVSLLPATYGAGVAWCVAANRDVDVTPVVDRLLEARAGVGARLAELGNLYRHLGVTCVNGSPLMVAMLGHRPHLRGRLDAAAAGRAELVVDEAMGHFGAVPFAGPRAEAVAAELVAACRLLRHGSARLRRHHGDGTVDDAALRRDFEEAAGLQRQAWLAGSRPGGLEDSLGRLAIRATPDAHLTQETR